MKGLQKERKKNIKYFIKTSYRQTYSTHDKYDSLFAPVMSTLGESFLIDSRLQQRGIADVIEEIIIDKYKELMTFKLLERSGKKSPDDFGLFVDGVTHWVDIKAHNLNGEFCMPNLTAIERLINIYDKSNLEMHYLIIDYVVSDGILTFKGIKHCQPHQISWDSLHVANLGLGQLQIKNMHKLIINKMQNEKEWYIKLCNQVVDFKYKTMEKAFDSIDAWEDKAKSYASFS
jgi:hypothetical protein